jgi:hypothetical protein
MKKSRLYPREFQGLNGPSGFCFTVGLRRVWLSLHLDGLEAIPGSRFGEPTKDNEIVVKQKISNESTSQNKIGAELEAKASRDSANMKGTLIGSRHANSKTTISTTSAEAISHTRVKARANLKWEVTESPSLPELDATYLNNEVLCKAIAQKGANLKAISILAYANQKDTTLTIEKGKSIFKFPSTNHEKMLKILISKALSGESEKYNGKITFSIAEEEVED